jgi:hypothetical protein
MARLRAKDARHPDIELIGTTIRLGRADDCNIVVDDPAVSRAHVRLELEGGVWRATDLDSKNGTAVDGVTLRPWRPEPLAHGARLELGGAVSYDFLLSDDERRGGSAPTMAREVQKPVHLTPTETEVLELLFMHYDEGRPAPRLATLQEIAQRRFTTTAAVKMVLQGLYDKFDLVGDERNKETLALRAQKSVTRTRY